MSVRIESSFPESINTYYNNNTYRKTVDTLYYMIESGEFSADQLHAAVELAETKEIIYGHRRMPTCKIEPMPGDKPKFVCDWCAHPIYFVNGKWTHRDDRLDNLSAHTPKPR